MNTKQDTIYTTIASPVRRKVLKLLRVRAMTAGEIADNVNVSKPTLSGHLNILKAAGLVTVEREGAYLRYHMNLSVAEDLLTGLAELFQLNTLEQDRPSTPSITQKGDTS